MRRILEILRQPGLAIRVARLETENRSLRDQLEVRSSEVRIIHAELEMNAQSMERMRMTIQADIAVLGTVAASGIPLPKRT